MVKLLIIGLDAAGFDLLTGWIQNGQLPYLEMLFRNGIKGKLKTTIPLLTPVVIPSFSSGKNPGKLGVYGFTKGQKLITSRDLPQNTIWEILSRNGLRSAVISVPLTYPPQEVNGYMISDSRFIPSKESNYTYPPELKRLAYDYPIGNPEPRTDRRGYFNADAELENLTKDMEKKFEIAQRILERDEDIALLLLYINETDTLHHRIWTRERHVLSFYKKIDLNIRELTEKSNCRNVIIFSDHGNEKYPGCYFNVNTWLRKEGFLKLRDRAPQEWIMSKIFGLSEKANIFRKVGYRIGSKLFKDKRLGIRPPGIDWGSTIAFAKSFGISIFKQNIPREEVYEDVRDRIITKMKEISDVDGKKIIKEIYKREEVYWGDKLDEYPDILFLTNGYFPNVIHYFKDVLQKMSDRERKNREGAVLEGTHVTSLASDAVFIATGEDFERGKEVRNVRIYDIAPTILHIFGLPVPKDMDGRVLSEIFKESSEPAQRQVKYQEVDVEQDRVRDTVKKLKEAGRL